MPTLRELEIKPSSLIIAVIIAGLLIVAGVGIMRDEESSSHSSIPSSSPSAEPTRDTATLQPPATITPQPISNFELRVLDFMEAWHTEDPTLRTQKLNQISTPAFRDANPQPPTESKLHAKVLNRHEAPRPIILSEPANQNDTVRHVAIGGVVIEKFDNEKFVIGFTAPTLSTVWVLQDDQWLIDSQEYPFD